MNHGLTDETVAEIRRVLSRFPVERAVLYGSRAKGTYRVGSDIDIVLAGPDLDRPMLGQIADELEDGWLPYRFDLSLHSDIRHAALLDHIQRVGAPLYEGEVIAAR